jgi:DUF4097 and DUF4098 domain-containing protein YvlB
MAVASALAVGLAPQQQMDTTFTVRSGGTLELESVHGSVVVNTWDREAVRVRTQEPVRARPRVSYSGGVVEIEPNPRGGSENVALEITLPRSFDVNIEGVNFAVTVDGVQGDVTVETMQGAVNVRGVTGDIDIEAVNGEVAVDNSRGNIVVEATNQNVRLTSIRGNIEVETTNGSITMLRAESTVVEVSTINGIVQYDGTVVDGGRYYLGTHNGSISMSFPERSNASVEVSTTNGQVQSTFGIPITSTRTRRFNFTLGSGSARVELESYNGSVRLVRPGGR